MFSRVVQHSMADDKALALLESLLMRGGHNKAARYLHEEFVRSRLILPKPGEPLVAMLPSGRSIGFRKALGLAKLAETIERLHNGATVQHLPRLVAALRDEMQAVLARCQGNPWLTATKPYRRLHALLKDPREPKARAKILQSWLEYQKRHPGGANAQSWGRAVVRGLGFTADLYGLLDRLASFNVEGLVLEVLEVLHSAQPVLQYQKAPVCLLLQQAKVISDSERVSAAEQVRPVLLHVLAVMVGFLLEQGQSLNRLLDLAAAEDCVPGATPREVLRTLRQAGEAHALVELSRAAVERTRALVLKPSPSPAVHPIGPSRSATALAHEATPDWTTLAEALNHVESGLPEEVMRALLEAALRRAELKRRYGLPAGEYWVVCPDPVLERAGIQRLTFSAGASGAYIQCVTAPLHLRFSLVVPPAGVTEGPLLLLLVAAIMYEALVTQRDGFTSQASRGQTSLKWAKAGHAASHTVSRTVVARIARPGVRSTERHGTTSAQGRASFVVPHLRRLRAGGRPGPGAAAHAADLGIRLPNGFTFVRGHIRGAEPSGIAREFTVAEVAMETMVRLRLQQRRHLHAGR